MLLQLEPEIHGVDLLNPPMSLRVKRKRAIGGNEEGFGKKMRYTDTAFPNFSPSTSRSVSVCTSQPSRDLPPMRPSKGIQEYIDFVEITDPQVLVVLKEEHITNHHSFSSGTITKDDLRGFGFPLGVISALLDNVSAFDQYLRLDNDQDV